MKSGDILHATLGTPTVLVCFGSTVSASAHLFQTSGQDVFTVALPAPMAAVTSNLIRCSRRHSTGAHNSRWFISGASVSLAAMPAPSLGERSNTDVLPIKTSPKPSKTERVELAVDSLHNYELIRPIPVLIESLGDKVFVAEAPDLNLSTTGNSVGAAFLLLKEQIITTYEGYRTRKGPDTERARQLAVFDQYISKSRRHWF